MATSRTFEILWGKLENEQRAFDALRFRISENKIPAEDKAKRLSIIKNNLEAIISRAQKELHDPWEEEMVIKSAEELLNNVTSLL